MAITLNIRDTSTPGVYVVEEVLKFLCNKTLVKVSASNSNEVIDGIIKFFQENGERIVIDLRK